VIWKVANGEYRVIGARFQKSNDSTPNPSSAALRSHVPPGQTPGLVRHSAGRALRGGEGRNAGDLR
jgi:hypothetical protein